MLEECGLSYNTVAINIGRGEQFSAEFLAVSPNNRIPAIVDHEEEIPVQEDGRFLGSGLVVGPRDVAPTDVALPVGPHGEEKALTEAHGGVDQPVAGDRTAGGGVGTNRFHPPEFLPGHGFVAVEGHRPGAYEQIPALRGLHDERGAVGLAHVAAPLGLSVGVEIAVVDTAGRVPDGFSGFLIHGHHELMVRAVKVEDEEILVENGRGAGTAEVIAGEVGALPDHLAIRSLETGRIGRPEGEIDEAVLKDRGGRGVRIEGVAELGFLHFPEELVVENLSVGLVEADHRELGSFWIGVGYPDTVSPDHWR